ncbi:molybdopterin molybdotransferase MoeA [Roseicyclus sp. F158]|uniref:Molybdopterin molybdenumtransferase n=1 Tax=Tropicimonas omnivorans TaxID=3075590 RepID=A0ABU3DGP3_9RHOB|nr:gephyrin-like molybdotransferase Glp [Roseicyclus sp. F158]MDT0682723.1 molybdopterin molybdotransferase MoeA [Roseicyclus sp. F158]
MISVADALKHIFSLASPLPAASVPISEAAGRVLAEDVVAVRDQPPFAASAMDGYAARGPDVAPGATLKVVGEAPAGRMWTGRIEAGECVRIFTGAPVPDGADHVVIQEDTRRTADEIEILASLGDGANIRPAGGDFRAGDRLTAPRRLTPGDIALAASMNAGTLTVARRPAVALLATGNELVAPGEAPARDQIVASNTYALKAMFEAEGADVSLLPIARDTAESLDLSVQLAKHADLLVTVGGVSVGDHDLVGDVTENLGMERAFHKVAMRPGKPLMAGRLGMTAMVGLPGNPVSSIVCGMLFVIPLLRAMQGLPKVQMTTVARPLAAELPANGPRAHYMRAKLGVDGTVRAFPSQDSSLLSILADATHLIVRPENDGPRMAGEMVETLPLWPGTA